MYELINTIVTDNSGQGQSFGYPSTTNIPWNPAYPNYPQPPWNPQPVIQPSMYDHLILEELKSIRKTMEEMVTLLSHNSHEEVCGSDNGGGGYRSADEEGSIQDCPNLTSWPPRKR